MHRRLGAAPGLLQTNAGAGDIVRPAGLEALEAAAGEQPSSGSANACRQDMRRWRRLLQRNRQSTLPP
jgi:hypothetical protein